MIHLLLEVRARVCGSPRWEDEGRAESAMTSEGSVRTPCSRASAGHSSEDCTAGEVRAPWWRTLS